MTKTDSLLFPRLPSEQWGESWGERRRDARFDKSPLLTTGVAESSWETSSSCGRNWGPFDPEQTGALLPQLGSFYFSYFPPLFADEKEIKVKGGAAMGKKVNTKPPEKIEEDLEKEVTEFPFA